MEPQREKMKDRKKNIPVHKHAYHSLYGQLRAYCCRNLHGSGIDQEDTFKYFLISNKEETDFFIFLKREMLYLRWSEMPFETLCRSLHIRSLYTSYF